MRVTWIGGWGVAPESLRPVAEKYFAQSQHTFLAPTAQVIESIAHQLTRPSGTLSPSDGERDGVRGAPDVLVAWSLGAWRVLEAASRGVEFSGMVLLLAPFVAFPSEAGLGGKCSATQVKYLRRWLQRDPLAALADFHQRGGLPKPLPRPSTFDKPTADESGPLSPSDGERDGVRGASATGELPYAMPDLLEGLDRLAEDATPALREFAARGLPRNWQALVGDSDPLLDGVAVCRAFSGCTLLRGAGHAIADLLRASQV
jgi:hypothetical protein